MSKQKRKTAELVDSAYQPTMAEKREEFALRKRDGSRPSVEEVAQAVLRPVSIRRIKRPRDRR
ncbi:MAG: hypothetical protein OXJ37_22705 [Bryobacterales bacterium]|nr:hypothetical protein [Bryobacterales bacterium]